MNNIRLFPLVLFATASLFILKGMGIIRHGHYTVTGQEPVVILAGGGGGHGTSATSGEGKTGIFAGTTANSVPRKECAPLVGALTSPKADDQLAEKLSEKRKELEDRLKDVELREGLLKAAEKKFDDRLKDANYMPSRTQSGGVDAQGRRIEEKPTDQIRTLVSMYDNMKPKDAAKIFDKLDMSIMAQLSLKLKPQKMAEIMAEMSPDVAKKLTTELAIQGNQSAAAPQNMGDLPKIDGRDPRS